MEFQAKTNANFKVSHKNQLNRAPEEEEFLRRELPEDVHAHGLEAVSQEMRDPRENVNVSVDGHDGEPVGLVRAEVERRLARDLSGMSIGNF